MMECFGHTYSIQTYGNQETTINFGQLNLSRATKEILPSLNIFETFLHTEEVNHNQKRIN